MCVGHYTVNGIDSLNSVCLTIMRRLYKWEKIIRKANDVNERLFNTAPRSTLKKKL